MRFVVFPLEDGTWSWEMRDGDEIVCRSTRRWVTADDAFKACAQNRAAMEHAEIAA
jgi:hypothetical protein